MFWEIFLTNIPERDRDERQCITNFTRFSQKIWRQIYILTAKLNTDLTENSFTRFRTRGGLNDHPSPLNAFYRLRMIILGRNPGLTQKDTNVRGSKALDEEESLFSTAMKA